MYLDTKKEGEALTRQTPVRALLWSAAEIIERCGHAKGHFEVDGAVCLFGALNAADHGDPVDCMHATPTWSAAAEFIKQHLGLSANMDVVKWNDAPERTALEVCAALRKAGD